MPLLGHGNEIKSPNKRVTHSDACEPWGYVAPVVAAVVTRATSVRHIYLINIHKFVIFVPHVFKDGWLLKVEVGNSYILLECIICHYVIAPLERKNTCVKSKKGNFPCSQ